MCLCGTVLLLRRYASIAWEDNFTNPYALVCMLPQRKRNNENARKYRMKVRLDIIFEAVKYQP